LENGDREEVGGDVQIEGDRELLARLRAMVVVPERLREEALAALGAGQAATVRVA